MKNPWPQEYWVIETNCGMHFVEELPYWLRITIEEKGYDEGSDPDGGWVPNLAGQKLWLSYAHIAEIRFSTKETRAKIEEMSRWNPDGTEPEPEEDNESDPGEKL